MFANLAAKVCQIVRNGKGREKQSAPRCVRSCETVKGENKTIKRQTKNSRESSLVRRDTWMAERAPCANLPYLPYVPDLVTRRLL